jgi:hypothetical protein
MDFKEFIKLQIVSSMGNNRGGISNITTGGNTDASGGFMALIYQAILMMFILGIEDILKALPKMFNEARDHITGYCSKRVKDTIAPKGNLLCNTSVTLSTRHEINTFSLTRTFPENGGGVTSGDDNKNGSMTSEDTNNIVDAILQEISKLDNVPAFSLIDKGQIMINYKEKSIQITKDIYVKIDSITWYPNGSVSSIRMSLLSNTISAADIATYVKIRHAEYIEEMKNSLGNSIYFFDQKSRDSGNNVGQSTVMTMHELSNDDISDDIGSKRSKKAAKETANAISLHKRMMINTAPKQLSFNMSQFYSNKKFSNIFGEQIKYVEKRLRFFLENKEWYDSKGVPYQLGLLLSGISGAGKTSCIRAIANLTKRHIINVNFANITTATQLKNLFFADKLQVYTDQSMSNMQSFFIPINQRLYVLEEIDAIGNIVKQRSYESSLSTVETINDELTLAEILTVLDGTIEAPGRIIIMTTNHREVLDEALVRPGRIDVNVRFGNATRDLISEMWKAYLEVGIQKESIDKLPHEVLSPAEVGQVLFRHFGVVYNESAIIYDLTRTAEDKIQNKSGLLTSKTQKQDQNQDQIQDQKQKQKQDQKKDQNQEPEIPLQLKIQLYKEKEEKEEKEEQEEQEENINVSSHSHSHSFSKNNVKSNSLKWNSNDPKPYTIDYSPMFATTKNGPAAICSNDGKIFGTLF